MPKLKDKYIGTIVKFNYRPDTIDERVIKEVFAEREYLDKVDFSSGLVIDVGAHIGTFSILAAGKRPVAEKDKSKIIAIEPEKNNFEVLQKNIEDNGLNEEVELVNKAVTGKKKDKITLKYYGNDKNTGGVGIDSKGKSFEVETVTLDEIIDNREVAFLKMDCEGAEYEILENSDLSAVDKISMEWHDIEKLGGLVKNLVENDFEILLLLGDKKRGRLQAKKR